MDKKSLSERMLCAISHGHDQYSMANCGWFKTWIVRQSSSLPRITRLSRLWLDLLLKNRRRFFQFSTSRIKRFENSEFKTLVEMSPGVSSCHYREVPPCISFSGSGFMATYQLGVAQCFLIHAPWILRMAPCVLGASAGSLVAAAVVCEMSPGEWLYPFFKFFLKIIYFYCM